MKHTEGNWTALNLHNNWLVVNEQTNNLIEIRANEANAKLIAAAPELLEALMNIENDGNTIPDTIWEMRCNAIKKATE